MEYEELFIENICNGGVIEAANYALEKVLGNINDPTYKQDFPREVIIKIKIRPDSKKEQLTADFDVSHKLAPIAGTGVAVFDKRTAKAYVNVMPQMPLFQELTKIKEVK